MKADKSGKDRDGNASPARKFPQVADFTSGFFSYIFP